jgi:hypothetical protein
MSDHGLIARIYKEFKNFSNQRINNPVKQEAHEMKKEFSKEEVQVANKYMKKSSTSLSIREIQMKTTLRFHLIPF